MHVRLRIASPLGRFFIRMSCYALTVSRVMVSRSVECSFSLTAEHMRLLRTRPADMQVSGKIVSTYEPKECSLIHL